jgi:uncharacterized protein
MLSSSIRNRSSAVGKGAHEQRIAFAPTARLRRHRGAGGGLRHITALAAVLAGAAPVGHVLPFNGRITIVAVGVAKYLDQPQIVRRSSGVELALAEFELWGEGMADMVARVLAEDLAARFAGGEVFAGDGTATVPADASVELYVDRFDPDPDGTLMLNARWTIRRSSSAARLGSERIAQRPTSATTADLVAAMSLAKLADHLAQMLIG